MKSGQSKKVYVAISGGVDSSVSAALLKQAGFDVIGVYMRQWAPAVLGKECLWKQDRQDAMKVCIKLGIPFETWDFSKQYERQVGRYMIDSYKKGITPNPDVICNKVIKFGLFFDRAVERGADFVATGHYARTSLAKSNFSCGSTSLRGFPRLVKIYLARSVRLFEAKDKNKDQTYFLWTLKQKHLVKTLFPVGNCTKPEVRKLAKKFGLHVAEKKDSQGVCFIGQFDMKNFLKKYIKPRKGKIIDIFNSARLPAGRQELEIGQHDGAWYYTIGQRHGLDIKNGKGPYFIVRKDIRKNIIYVGREKDLYSKKAKIKNINWIAAPQKFPVQIEVRTRYRAPVAKAELSKSGTLIFAKPEKAITSGQSAVLYKGQQVLGGGVIC